MISVDHEHIWGLQGVGAGTSDDDILVPTVALCWCGAYEPMEQMSGFALQILGYFMDDAANDPN